MRDDKKEELRVGFVGNPNCGKTTLFNAYTGSKLKVANWPGVTVEKKEGAMKYHNHTFHMVDLPGIYSLTSYTMEEKLSREFILSGDVDVIVNVADASGLERNLYLSLQLIELGKPVVLALNMMDIIEDRGMEIDFHRLPEMLGIPCIPVSARKQTGLDILMHTVAHHEKKHSNVNFEHQHKNEEKESRHMHDHHKEYAMVYSDEIEDKIDEITERLLKEGMELSNCRWYAIKLLEQDEEIIARYPIDLSDVIDRSYESDIINQKYEFIEEIVEECLVNKYERAAVTDKADALLTHRIWGIPMFLGIMALVFFLTFTIGDWLKGYFEGGLDFISGGAASVMESVKAQEWLTSLVVDGIIAGVGGILTFLPNIFILFLALAFLEDSGYMARVAYVMNGIMAKLGLSGRAFIPMVLGFGCSVPAVMASRTLEDIRDRRRVIFITPFMSCSARLPIYVLFSELFFRKYAIAAAFSMYVMGLLVAILTAFVMNKAGKKEQMNPLLIELPEYKTPNAHTIAIYVWDKVKDYLSKAGTTIFIASIIIWFVLNFGPNGMIGEDMVTESFGALAGKGLAPLLVPAGLGMWQIVVALISGLAAKEVVVSSFSVLFGIANITSASGMSNLIMQLGDSGFHALHAYAFMAFCLLYTPCAATIAVVRRELRSTKLTLIAVGFQLFVAWAVAVLIYQVGSVFI